MSKILILIYGVVAYAVGMGGLTFFILYVGGWSFMPIHVDSGEVGPIGTAIMMNVGLILLWGVQHSVMARPGFKEIWTRVIPKSIERSTYTLLSGILMLVICLNWRALDGMLWDVESSIPQTILLVLHVCGWVIAVIATFLINHFELFGLQQVWLNFKEKPEPSPSYTEKFLYKIVRHPLQMGILMGLWFTPTMSMTLFFLSATMTIYIFIGLHFEEKDLVKSLGESYADYQSRVRKLLPIPK
ncbi:MAG: hypothetical protein HQ498_01415 [Pseudohongiella sp.]|jgi:methanethiol S-methyltransferase|nr:hypothetical protein [Pseudohongiella sp.]